MAEWVFREGRVDVMPYWSWSRRRCHANCSRTLINGSANILMEAPWTLKQIAEKEFFHLNGTGRFLLKDVPIHLSHLVGFLWQHGNCHFNSPSALEFKVARRQNSELVEMFTVMLILFPVYLFLIQFCFPDLSSPLYFSFRQTPCLCILNTAGIAAAEEAQPRISRTNEALCTSLPVSTSSHYFCRPAISTKTFAKFGSSGNFAADLGFGWVGLWLFSLSLKSMGCRKSQPLGSRNGEPRWVDRGAGGAATSPHLGDHRRRDAKISQAVWVFGTAFYSISLLFLREKCDCFNAWDLQVISIEWFNWMFVRFESFFLVFNLIDSSRLHGFCLVATGCYRFAWRQLPQWHNASYDFLWLTACIFVGQLFFICRISYPSELSKFLVFSKIWPVERGREAKKAEISPLLFQPSLHQLNSGGWKDTIAFERSMGNAWCSSDTWLFLGEIFVTHIFFAVTKKKDRRWELVSCPPQFQFQARTPVFPLFTEFVNVINFGIWRLQIHEESWSSEARLQISTDPFFPAEKSESKAVFFCSNKFPKTMLTLLTSLTFSSNVLTK